MKKRFTLLLMVLSTVTFGQINMADSTAQVIAYWGVGDTQSYSVWHQSIKMESADTIANEVMTYDVDITVVDSTDHSYLVEWLYSNYKTNSSDEILQKIIATSEDLVVLVETDELGMFQGVRNWEAVSNYMKKAMSQVRDEYQDIPELEQMLDQLESMYTTRQAIETAAIQEVHQFHHFHGGKYLLGEVVEFPMQVPNVYYPDRPFDSKVTLYLDEINPEDGNFILRSIHEVDSQQLTSATFDYLKSVAESMGSPAPQNEEIPQLSHTTMTASRIHDSGWLIYSIQTKTVEAQGAKEIEENIIEIK